MIMVMVESVPQFSFVVEFTSQPWFDIGANKAALGRRSLSSTSGNFFVGFRIIVARGRMRRTLPFFSPSTNLQAQSNITLNLHFRTSACDKIMFPL
jgi:hypothetical protein